jgi:hypothetical protein
MRVVELRPIKLPVLAMSFAVRRTLLSLIVLSALASCSRAHKEDRPPIVEGSFLEFEISESTRKRSTSILEKDKYTSLKRVWRLTFSERLGGLKVTPSRDGEAEPSMSLTSGGAVIGVLQIPSTTMPIGTFFLTPSERRGGEKLRTGGFVRGNDPKFKDWDVAVVSFTGATLYYEKNTGMLVGWLIRIGYFTSRGTLVNSG